VALVLNALAVDHHPQAEDHLLQRAYAQRIRGASVESKSDVGTSTLLIRGVAPLMHFGDINSFDPWSRPSDAFRPLVRALSYFGLGLVVRILLAIVDYFFFCVLVVMYTSPPPQPSGRPDEKNSVRRSEAI
jgi:hypothetical protein